jgi:hypothetical protein
MTPFAQYLQRAYYKANIAHIEGGHGKLRKGQFMEQAYPTQKYKNEASARRQFNKVTSERGGRGVETSGKKIEKRGKIQLPGGGQEGLWKVTVDYYYEDNDGTFLHAQRSFTITSMQYTRLEDVPYIYAILPPLVDEKIRQWQDTGSYPQNATNIQVTIEPAAYTNLPQSRQTEIDGLEIG